MFNDTADTIIGTEPNPPASEATTDTSTTETEQKLATEITQLWAVHNDAQSVIKKSQVELKLLRQRLGENLFQMKALLARPGRNGGWSSFLEQHGISRTTADRLVLAHQKSLSPDGNSTTGSVPELTDEEIAELAKATWKKLQKKLGDKRVVYAFLGHLIAESGLGNFRFHRGDQHGLAVIDPDAASTPDTTTDASAAAPTSAA